MIVWLASYPRSGNTFFRVLMNSVFHVKTYSIYNDKNDIAADEKTADIVGHKDLNDGFDLDELRDDKELYYIKTHGMPDIVQPTDKVIYLIRDGRESSLSFFNYLKDYSNKEFTLNQVIAGDPPFGTWGEHVLNWQKIFGQNTLAIKFEELTANPQSSIEVIATFLNIEPTQESIPTFNDLQKINPKFFRSGKNNSWETTFRKTQTLYFDFKNNKPLLDFNYKSSVLDEDNTDAIPELISYFEELLSEEKDRVMKEKDRVLKEKDNALKEKDRVLKEKDNALKEKDNALKEKDKTIISLQSRKNISA